MLFRSLLSFDEEDPEHLRVYRLLETTRSSEEILGKRKERKERRSAVNSENASRGWEKRRAKAAAAAANDTLRLQANGCDCMQTDATACEKCLPTPTPTPTPKNASLVDPGIPRDAREGQAANPDPSELDRPPTLQLLPWPSEAITVAERALADPDGRPAPDGALVGPEDFLAEIGRASWRERG